MKPLLLFFISVCIGFASVGQVSKSTTTLNTKPISVEQTAELKKTVRIIKLETDRLYDSIINMRKGITQLMKQLNKKPAGTALSTNESLRIQKLLSDFQTSEMAAMNTLKKLEDSTSSLIRKWD